MNSAIQLRPEELIIPPPATSGYFRWKGWVDRGLGVILLIPGLPLIALLMVLVRLTSRGPAIYRQKRVGKNGETFHIYKLRSMVHRAESRTGPVWTAAEHPQITPFGRVLRRFQLDELPQLLNVVQGDMALIGPRPERPEFARVLAAHIPGYQQRLAVLPGITGLAQVNLPADTDLESVRRKLKLDLEYIETAGVLLDVRMLISAFLHLLGVDRDWSRRMMKLHRQVSGFSPDDLASDVNQPVEVTPEEVALQGYDLLQEAKSTWRQPRKPK